jgi:hypothetical protein
LVTLSYGYLLSAFIELIAFRVRHRGTETAHPAQSVIEHQQSPNP